MRQKLLLVLEILDRENRWMYAQEVVETSGRRIGRGGVYGLLGNLSEQGFVETREDPGGPIALGLLTRTQYHVTHTGRRAHQDAAALSEGDAQPAHT